MPNQLFNFLLRQQAAVADDDEAIDPINFLFQEEIKPQDIQKKKKKIDRSRVEGDQRLYSDYLSPQPTYTVV